MTDTDELIVGRYYWVQFYEVGSWQLGRWSQYGDFDTSTRFNQDWKHPKPIQWLLIPSPEELLSCGCEVGGKGVRSVARQKE